MNDHDIIATHERSVTCRCGVVIEGRTLDDAQRRHTGHYGIHQSRAALKGDKPE